MAEFRCYFLDRGNHIVTASNLEAPDVEAAKAHSYGILNNQYAYSDAPAAIAIEIWSGACRLFPPNPKADAHADG